MKNWFLTLALLALSTAAVGRDETKPPLVAISGPTIIAFCPPFTEADLKDDPGNNEILADFQFYAERVRAQFKQRNIRFEELYVRSFRVSQDGKTTVFRPSETQVGYYFVAPGSEPRIEYGVMTDSDLLAAADEYFHASGKPPK